MTDVKFSIATWEVFHALGDLPGPPSLQNLEDPTASLVLLMQVGPFRLAAHYQEALYEGRKCLISFAYSDSSFPLVALHCSRRHEISTKAQHRKNRRLCGAIESFQLIQSVMIAGIQPVCPNASLAGCPGFLHKPLPETPLDFCLPAFMPAPTTSAE